MPACILFLSALRFLEYIAERVGDKIDVMPYTFASIYPCFLVLNCKYTEDEGNTNNKFQMHNTVDVCLEENHLLTIIGYSLFAISYVFNLSMGI